MLDPRYIVTSDITNYAVDKDSGQPMANGILTFYRDSARTVLKAIYQLTGAPPAYTYTALPNPLTLSNVGTVQNAGGDNIVIYYLPYIIDPSTGEEVLDLYYIECRDEDGNLQFTREAWPNIASVTPPAEEDTVKQNQLSNPTFTNIFINEDQPTNLTVSAGTDVVFPLGPNWDFVVSGTGTVIVQRFAKTGNDNVPTSPPYELDVNVGVGITKCLLRQRFPYNSGLWTSTVDNPLFLTGLLVAKNAVGGTASIQMYYAESDGVNASVPVLILNKTFGPNYEILVEGTSAQIPSSTNTDLGRDGYVDIYLQFTLNTHVVVTSLQLIPSFTETQTSPYDLDSSNRNEAYQGDYYIPRLNKKQISSYLVGWDFPVNPFQFGSAGGFISLPSAYIADQTIISSVAGGVTTTRWDRHVATQALSLGFLAAASPVQSIYIMQYLSGNIVKKMLGTSLSVNVFAYQTAGVSPITMRVYLFRSPSTAPIPTGVNPGTIGTMNSIGVFTLTQAGWTAIPRSNLDTATATLNMVTTSDQINDFENDHGFSQWQITDATQIDDTANFAIVVTFAATSIATVLVNSISVIPGDIPSRPAIVSQDQSLRECQFYYSKSFFPGTAPVNAFGLNTGESVNIQVAGPNAVQSTGPIIRFPTSMRATPTIILYNPAANNGQIRDESTGADWSISTAVSINANGFYSEGTTPVVSSTGNVSAVHWSADARLGLV